MDLKQGCRLLTTLPLISVKVTVHMTWKMTTTLLPDQPRLILIKLVCMFLWPPPPTTTPPNIHVPFSTWTRIQSQHKRTLAPAGSHLSMLLLCFLLNNISKLNSLEAPPAVHISPDSRSSELDRRSRSHDTDLSRSFSLAMSGEVDLSLSSQSL